ncbi:ABC transporter ATP-binding protein [Actinomycetaceae bacterium WB03_NA08]|uniref:ABC transporter ATP-binding protein n=1 Tax=Scrofimicrobium canadense TaxID=2652290 RepID=A0A6N7W3P8_9ACTO|nr:ABC transporter ATP-binding protein [Scrofimicrobium canadense]MSS84031.1 ABC transporter ATP-binding protein [Scrofimicrobium canadense]
MRQENQVPAAMCARNISKSFGDVRAVNDVSVTVEQGEIIALLGENGAGKTTLIDIVLGLQKPDSGDVKLFDFTPHEAIQRSLVGVVNQSGGLALDSTVEKTLSLFSSFHRAPLPLEQLIEIAHLEELRKRRVVKLSGGERQRLRLALALISDPLLLILDEPTTGMDASARQEFWQVMADEAKRGRTVLFATHYFAEAEDYAQRTIVMKRGRIVADAPTDTLRNQAAGRLQIDIPWGGRAELEPLLTHHAHSDWQVFWDEKSVSVMGADLDDAARVLLNFPETKNLRVTRSSLEDVFTDLMRGALV